MKKRWIEKERAGKRSLRCFCEFYWRREGVRDCDTLQYHCLRICNYLYCHPETLPRNCQGCHSHRIRAGLQTRLNSWSIERRMISRDCISFPVSFIIVPFIGLYRPKEPVRVRLIMRRRQIWEILATRPTTRFAFFTCFVFEQGLEAFSQGCDNLRAVVAGERGPGLNPDLRFLSRYRRLSIRLLRPAWWAWCSRSRISGSMALERRGLFRLCWTVSSPICPA